MMCARGYLEGLFGGDADEVGSEAAVEAARALLGDDLTEAVEGALVEALAVGPHLLVLEARLDHVDRENARRADHAWPPNAKRSKHYLFL